MDIHELRKRREALAAKYKSERSYKVLYRLQAVTEALLKAEANG